MEAGVSMGAAGRTRKEPLQKIVLPNGASITGDLPPDRMKLAAFYFDLAIQKLCEFECRKPDARGFRLRTYRQLEAYQRVAGGGRAASFYSPKTRRIYLPWPDWADEKLMIGILLHETVHAWMHDSFGKESPPPYTLPWFNEGMAEHFSTFALDEGELVHVEVPPQLACHLPAEPIPPNLLMRYTYDHFYSCALEHTQALYASSWALVAYLMAQQPDDISSILNGQPAITVPEDDYLTFYEQLRELRT